MMLELKEERRAELAKKGFRISIIVAVIGIIAARGLLSAVLGSAWSDLQKRSFRSCKDTRKLLALHLGHRRSSLADAYHGNRRTEVAHLGLLPYLRHYSGIPGHCHDIAAQWLNGTCRSALRHISRVYDSGICYALGKRGSR